jgi:hypothetical protein
VKRQEPRPRRANVVTEQNLLPRLKVSSAHGFTV